MFFKSRDMTDKQKQEMLKTFVLSLHAEVTGIADGVSYKEHRLQDIPVDRQKILYKSVDAYRYILAILNLWDFAPHEFVRALSQKDDFLHYRHELAQKKWSGQPIVLFDMDDVLADFRKSFCKYCTDRTGHPFDPLSKEYYNVSEFKSLGLNSESFFRDFIDNQHGFLGLSPNESYVDLFKQLQSEGYWMQIVTARPEKNLAALYDTFSWLKMYDIHADGVAFTPEKFVWLTDQPFFAAGRYVAIDDSAKHAAEYAKHGVRCVVPKLNYNAEVEGIENVFYVESAQIAHETIKSLMPV
jgi:beta-phosphoglucomutase-like phosphatase (HAD superfamily)